MNINEFAVIVTEIEGGKKSISIAQVKEALKIIRNEILSFSGIDIYKIIKKI